MVAKKKVKKAAKKVVKKVVKKTVKKTVKKAKPRVAKKAVKKASPAKKKAVTRAKKKPVKKLAKAVAKKKKPVSKTSSKKKIVRRTVKAPVKSVVKKAIKNKTKGGQKADAKKVVKKPAAKKIKLVAKKEVAKKPAIKNGKKVYVVIEPDVNASSTAGPLEFSPYDPRKNESYMSQAQQLHFRSILIEWKDQLMHEVDSTVVHLQEDVTSYADPSDRASQEEEFNLELRTRDRERKLIKKIEQAIDWIEQGVYGYCEDCGADIGIRRLEARPTAAKCIDCKTFSEIREKQIGST